MDDAQLIDRLAAVAHDLWSARQRDRGWRAGPRYDQPGRVHDALVPFEELSPLDRRNATLTAQLMADQLVASIEYPRGPDREFVPEEMREGLPVGWTLGAARANSPQSAATEVGRVVAWEVDVGTPFLRSIRVRWPGGEETEHRPSLRELRRV